VASQAVHRKRIRGFRQRACPSYPLTSDDVPYNVQVLAHSCWAALHSGDKSKLTVDLVETVFERTVESHDRSFTERWNRLTLLQKKTLIAVLQGNGQRSRPAEIARTIKSSASSVRSALRSLYNRNILWDDANLAKVRLRMEDPFFAHWIRLRAMNAK